MFPAKIPSMVEMWNEMCPSEQKMGLQGHVLFNCKTYVSVLNISSF
jgi:hypothetical protein